MGRWLQAAFGSSLLLFSNIPAAWAEADWPINPGRGDGSGWLTWLVIFIDLIALLILVIVAILALQDLRRQRKAR